MRSPTIIVYCTSKIRWPSIIYPSNTHTLIISQVYAVVDEMFLAGEIRETSQQKVLSQLQYLNTLD